MSVGTKRAREVAVKSPKVLIAHALPVDVTHAMTRAVPVAGALHTAV